MNKMNRIIIVFFICAFVKCQSQDIKSNILGKWESVNLEIDKIKDFKTLEGNDPIADIKIIIYEKNLDLIESDIPFKNISYQIIKEDKKQLLTFGNRRYFIEKLESNELVLLEDKKVLPARIYFRKNVN